MPNVRFVNTRRWEPEPTSLRGQLLLIPPNRRPTYRHRDGWFDSFPTVTYTRRKVGIGTRLSEHRYLIRARKVESELSTDQYAQCLRHSIMARAAVRATIPAATLAASAAPAGWKISSASRRSAPQSAAGELPAPGRAPGCCGSGTVRAGGAARPG